MPSARAFAPGHISGFFGVYNEHPNPARRGSKGGGVCIDRGAWSTVTLEEGEGRIDIQINGETATAPVTKLAIHQIIRGLELDAVVETTLDLPVGQGFGMSAAGSLSACVAAREVLDIMGVEASVPEPLFCTHVAEVKMMTGMGDAVAQSMGGIVAREKAGIPPFGEAKKELSKEKIVVCIVGEPLPTQDILADSDRIADISDAASSLVPVFAEHLSLDVLVELSRRFVKKTDLMSPEVMAALEEVDKIGRGSMIMLGNAIFAIGNEEKLLEALEAHGDAFVVGVDRDGARVEGERVEEGTEGEGETLEGETEEGLEEAAEGDTGETIEGEGAETTVADEGLKIKGDEGQQSADGLTVKSTREKKDEELKIKAPSAEERGVEPPPGEVMDLLGGEEEAGAATEQEGTGGEIAEVEEGVLEETEEAMGQGEGEGAEETEEAVEQGGGVLEGAEESDVEQDEEEVSEEEGVGETSDGMKMKAPPEEGEDLRVKAPSQTAREDDLKIKEEEHPGEVVDLIEGEGTSMDDILAELSGNDEADTEGNEEGKDVTTENEEAERDE